jgi:hypothetical protein
MPTLSLGLSTVALIFMTLWLLGSISSVTLGGGLHLFLIAAIGIMVPRIVRGRRAAD